MVTFILWQFLYFCVLFVQTGGLLHADKCSSTKAMLDASSKLPSSMILGNLIEIGGFDECLAINIHKDYKNIKGKYCLVQINQPDIKIKLGCRRHLDFQTNLFGEFSQRRNEINESDCSNEHMKLILGWCLPDICPIFNISAIVSSILNISEDSVKPLVNTGMCQTMDGLNAEINSAELGAIVFFSIILIIVSLSTLYDIYMSYLEKDPPHLILISFSLKTNSIKLLSVTTSSDDLSCLHGMRFLSMMWIMLGHRFIMTILEPIENFNYMHEWAQSTANLYLTYTFVSVDTFLLLSGLLVAYTFFITKDKGEKFNIISYYLHRYIRLTPAFACVILIHATILNRLGNGPFWPITAPPLSEPCVKYWWTNFLYIQNYYNPGRICMDQTWYLAADMQLFVLSPIILLPACKWPKKTMLFCAVLLFGSVVSSFIVSWYYDLTAFMMQADQNYMTKYYTPTHTRYGPWLMGIMLGYYIFLTKKTKYTPAKLTPLIVSIGWITSLSLLALSLFGSYPLFFNHNHLGAAIYNGIHRQVWALGLCWIVYACVHGYGGFINNFLSWQVFQILGRLTYGMYLIHLSLQYFRGATRRAVFFVSVSTFINEYFIDFCYSVLLAACLTLTFELPILAIEKSLKTHNRIKCKNVEGQVYSI